MTEEQAIANAMNGKDFIRFNGQNCDDYDDRGCEGWDGESRRCSCGNRRVYWEFYKFADGTMEAYGEAY